MTISLSSPPSYGERALYCEHPLTRELLLLMEKKETNLCASLDVTKSQDLLNLADQLGPDIAVLKTHIDIVEDFTPDLPKRLMELAEKHRFLIFEDRKFADIGNTVKMQYGGGIYRIADWAHITNAHAISGPGMIDALKEVGMPKGRGLLLLAQMSSEGSLATGSYTEKAVEWALNQSDFVTGFVAQERVTEDPRFIHFTPGIRLTKKSDQFGQQYSTPFEALARGTDVFIVGRGLYEGANPKQRAKEYRKGCWIGQK